LIFFPEQNQETDSKMISRICSIYGSSGGSLAAEQRRFRSVSCGQRARPICSE
jgi:hypothetical protein